MIKKRGGEGDVVDSELVVLGMVEKDFWVGSSSIILDNAGNRKALQKRNGDKE